MAYSGLRTFYMYNPKFNCLKQPKPCLSHLAKTLRRLPRRPRYVYLSLFVQFSPFYCYVCTPSLAMYYSGLCYGSKNIRIIGIRSTISPNSKREHLLFQAFRSPFLIPLTVLTYDIPAFGYIAKYQTLLTTNPAFIKRFRS